MNAANCRAAARHVTTVDDEGMRAGANSSTTAWPASHEMAFAVASSTSKLAVERHVDGLPRLKEAGGEGIVEFPLNKIVM